MSLSCLWDSGAQLADVDVVTFDELAAKAEALLQIFRAGGDGDIELAS